jgi:4'-phosphopantetheinyl transferase
VAEDALWVRPSKFPVLKDREAHVWRVPLGPLSSSHPGLDEILTDQELWEASVYASYRDRQRYVTVRGILRQLLGRYLGLDPSTITLTRGPYGKPEIAVEGQEPPLFFNVAHSRDLALIAIARDFQVGIDIEAVNSDFEWDMIARRFFTAREHASLTSTPDSERADAFTTVWTRKEACLKAAGLGLARGLEGVEVSTGAGHSGRLMAVPEEMLPTSRWQIIDLEPADGYRGCLVADSRTALLRRWSWPVAESSSPRGRDSMPGRRGRVPAR